MADNKTIVQQFLDECMGRRNLDAADDLLIEGYRCHDPLVGELGIGGFKAQMQEMFDGFPDLAYNQAAIFGEGDLVGVRWWATGTQDGDFLGIPATGRCVTMDGLSIFRLENGRIAEEWDQYDALGMLRELGIVKLEEETGEAVTSRQVETQPTI